MTSDKLLTEINLGSLQRIVQSHLHILIKYPGDMQIMNQSKRTTLGPTLACYIRPLLRLDLKTPQNNLPNLIL